jgi:protocatechuate 3,4-dioxygenase beta subunit
MTLYITETDQKANIEIWEASRAGNYQETKELKEVNKNLILVQSRK